MSVQNPQPSEKQTKGYGKHSVRYWVLVYVAVAIIVYGLVYLLFIHKTGANGGGLNY